MYRTGRWTSDPEVAALADAVNRVLASAGHGVEAGQGPSWRDSWPALAGLGLVGLCVPEEQGGVGDEVPAALMASEELGAALYGSPYAALVAAGSALARTRPAGRAVDLVDAVVSGEHVTALAFLQRAASVTVEGDSAVVDGPARLVLGAEECDSVVVFAGGSDTIALLLRDESWSTGPRHGFDVTRSCADMSFTGARGLALATPPGEREQAVLRYRLLLAGDAVGGVRHTLDRTVAYAGERTAFGQPIGGFQAVQHRLVDHAIRLRGMALATEQAARAVAARADGAPRAVAIAEAAVGRHAVSILHDLLQLTGAIGFTWEHGLHLYERRAHLDARLARAPRAAIRSLARMEGWVSSADPA